MTELFSVYDQAANMFLEPFPAPTIEFAIRGFREACERDDHQFSKFPEDYALYHVGSFNPEDGLIVSVTASKISMASNFVRTDTS